MYCLGIHVLLGYTCIVVCYMYYKGIYVLYIGIYVSFEITWIIVIYMYCWSIHAIR